MPTGHELKESIDWLKSQGKGNIFLLEPIERADWYKPDGSCIKGLPARAHDIEIYRGKGWTLKAPTEEEVATWKATHPSSETVGVEPAVGQLSPMLQKELAEVTGTVLEAPPRHIHVYQEAIGSPCLVLGCASTRAKIKTPWKKTRRS